MRRSTPRKNSDGERRDESQPANTSTGWLHRFGSDQARNVFLSVSAIIAAVWTLVAFTARRTADLAAIEVRTADLELANKGSAYARVKLDIDGWRAPSGRCLLRAVARVENRAYGREIRLDFSTRKPLDITRMEIARDGSVTYAPPRSLPVITFSEDGSPGAELTDVRLLPGEAAELPFVTNVADSSLLFIQFTAPVDTTPDSDEDGNWYWTDRAVIRACGALSADTGDVPNRE